MTGAIPTPIILWSESALCASRSVKRIPNSPPLPASSFQMTSPEAITVPFDPASNLHESGCPISGRYAVRRCIPSSETSIACASNDGPRAPPTSTKASKGIRVAPGARRSSVLMTSSRDRAVAIACESEERVIPR